MLLAHLIDIHNLANEVVRRCNKHGLSVRFDDVPTAHTNFKEVVFPHLVPPITVRQLKLLITQMIHEPGHQLRSEALRLLEAARIKQGNPIHALWNMAEDECMEREVQARWRGDRKGLVEGHAVLAEDVAANWRQHRDKEVQEHSKKAMATYLVAMDSRKDWDYLAETNIDLMRRSVPTEVTELADDLIAEGWSDKLAQGGDPAFAKQWAYDMFERLYPEHKAEDQEQPDTGSQGDGDEGEGESQGEGEEDGEGEGGTPKKGDSKTDTFKDKGVTNDKTVVIKWSDILQSDHGQEIEGSPMEIDWSGKDVRTGARFFTEDRIREYEYGRDRLASAMSNRYGSSPVGDKQFANQVRRLIQAENRTKHVSELKSGKLDKRNMIRVLMPTREGGEWNKRVFHDVEETRSLNTAVIVLTDWSGSMSGTKMKVAANASVRLVDVFDRCLHVPTELLSFTCDWNHLQHGVIKSFNERSLDANTIGARFAHFEQYSSGNADGDAIMWALKRLLKRHEMRKVLIVLSDGSPSMSCGEASGTLTAAIKEARRLGVEIHGIGIESTAVRFFYGEDAHVINDAKELNTALIGTLTKVVRNGRL